MLPLRHIESGFVDCRHISLVSDGSVKAFVAEARIAMILYYAVGGGLGHLTRAQAVVYSLGLTDNLALISASPFGDDPRILRKAQFIAIPEALGSNMRVFREWLVDVVDALHPSCMFIDAFPCGLLGEFCNFPFPKGLQLYHVARLLRWPRYRERIQGEPPLYEISFCVEPLTADHNLFLRSCSNDIVSLELTDPPPTLDTPEVTQARKHLSRAPKTWLVVHSSPSWEIEKLCEIAINKAIIDRVDPHFVVVAPRKPMVNRAKFSHFSVYPASALFSQVDRLFSACGFNTMRQGKRSGIDHVFVPFQRALDDQYLRAERHHIMGSAGESQKNIVIK